MKDVKDYTKEIEDLFIQFLISDPELFIRCKSITSPEYFSDHENREVISFFESHSNSYSILPTVEQVRAVTGKKIEKIQNYYIQYSTSNDKHSDKNNTEPSYLKIVTDATLLETVKKSPFLKTTYKEKKQVVETNINAFDVIVPLALISPEAVI